MTSTAKSCLVLALILAALLLLPRPRPRPHPRASLDDVLDHLLSHLVSEVQQLTGIARSDIASTTKKIRGLAPLDSLSLALKLCGLLSGKKLLFIGPETTYHLHSLWLGTLEVLENRSHPCLGSNFCTFHHICRLPSQGLALSSVDSFSRKKKMPSRQALLLDNSSLLLYSLSSTLYASLDNHDAAYTQPQVDQYTQVRQSNTYWRRQARKADIVIMNRPPLPAPASTYPNGNWTFAESLCMDSNYLAPLVCDDTLENILINAAIHATVKHFLPSLLETLQAVSLDPEMKGTRLLWHSNWYIPPLCAKSGLPRHVPLLRDILFGEKRDELIDPWSYYYNTQEYVQRRLLPEILPYFRATYLDLETPNDSGPTYMRFFPQSQAPSLARPKDCIRHPFGGHSLRLEQVFLDEMIQVLQLP